MIDTQELWREMEEGEAIFLFEYVQKNKKTYFLEDAHGERELSKKEVRTLSKEFLIDEIDEEPMGYAECEEYIYHVY